VSVPRPLAESPLLPAPQELPTDGTPVTRLLAMGRGARRRCPRCGLGKLFRGYLAPEPICTVCRADLLAFRADDAPAYFTILIVGHIVVPGMLWLEMTRHPPMFVHLMIWLPLTVVLTFGLLPHIKGAIVGLLWSLGVRE
jgi:uncharacterized protein (DUF983 family)